MDKTVPAGAALLLDFIGQTEAPRGYDTIYGNNQGKLPKPLTGMTIGEVLTAQPGWTKSFGSSAAGRYQIMKATLEGLLADPKLGLTRSMRFDANLQDRLGFHLLKRRGYAAFMAGQIGLTAFGKSLAQEWASFPVLSATQGNKRKVERGQSYYAGDGVNKALVKPETVEVVLFNARAAASAPPPPDIPLPREPIAWNDAAALTVGGVTIVKPADPKPQGFLAWLKSLFA
ncbi:hypothetical protein [Bosea sp. MMO-172]|uniref:hypothetical protein n=1 Tax=Bosea sp. MMO-172 TaxID=3127885 RepID=UPI00301AD4A3